MKRLHMQRIGYRTIKTVLASLVALLICSQFEKMDPVLVLLGVYCAMERTIADSWLGCLSQFFGVLVGSALGFLLLLAIPAPPEWLIALCLVAVIYVCNLLHMSYAVFLSSLIFVSVCTGSATAADIFGRIRDVSLGLTTGLIVNIFVHPNSNEPRIYACIRALQQQTLLCAEQAVLYGRYPDMEPCRKARLALARELEQAKKQLFLFSRRQYEAREAMTNGCAQLAMRMAQEIEAISSMDVLAVPSPENLQRLLALGLSAPDEPRAQAQSAEAAALNYHLDCFLRAYGFLEELLPHTSAETKQDILVKER